MDSNIINRIKKSLTFRLTQFVKHTGRLSKLRNTCGKKLKLIEIDSLELLELCRESGKNIDIVYDIGANIGTWTLLAKSVLQRSRIIAFEPLNNHIQEFLELTREILDDVSVFPVALGSENNESIIYVTNRTDSSSLLRPTKKQAEIFGVKPLREEKITVRRLDDFVRENNLPLPDLIKLDIQGFELEALRGSVHCLKSCKFIIAEISFIELYKNQPLFEEISEFLFRYGFRLVAVGYNTATGIKLTQSDFLFENTLLR